MKKRIVLALLLCLAMCISMLAVGCNDDTPENPDDGNTPVDPGNGDQGNTGDDNGDNNGDGNQQNTNIPSRLIYNFTFKNSDGEAIADVMAGICVDGNCNAPQKGDADGKLTLIILEPEESSVITLNIVTAAGYKIPTEKPLLDRENFDVTITLEKAD